MNKHLDDHVSLGEFLRYIGLWLVIVKSSPANMGRGEFWNGTKPDRKKGAPFRLNDLMTGKRFEELTKSLCYTTEKAPPYKDPFWEVVTEWNRNMQLFFISIYLS